MASASRLDLRACGQILTLYTYSSRFPPVPPLHKHQHTHLMHTHASYCDNQLNKAGTAQPSDDSLRNTMRLYELVGRPLDSLPSAPADEVGGEDKDEDGDAKMPEAEAKREVGIKTVHVGGTNGKGSVSFKVANCLQLAGLRTGLFVSPHISCFRERIQVDGALISEADVLRLLPQVLQLCAYHAISATLFEVAFILACLFYR